MLLDSLISFLAKPKMLASYKQHCKSTTIVNQDIPPPEDLLNTLEVLIEFMKRAKTEGALDIADSYGDTALHNAVSRKNHAAARMLIEHGANVNLQFRVSFLYVRLCLISRLSYIHFRSWPCNYRSDKNDTAGGRKLDLLCGSFFSASKCFFYQNRPTYVKFNT